MRRLPIYFLIDVSASMAGDPIAQVEKGMHVILQELRSNPYALETAHIGIIIFAEQQILLSPLTELYAFQPPSFPIGGGTALGGALRALMREIDASVQKTTAEKKGDWQPLVFLFTDGEPTDAPGRAIAAWNEKYRRRCRLVAVAIGESVDTTRLCTLTDDVLRLKETSPEAFRQFFQWISASIQTSSVCIASDGAQDVPLPEADGVVLEKIEQGSPRPVFSAPDTWAIFLDRCPSSGKLYLIKYGRQPQGEGLLKKLLASSTSYHLVGAYPLDEPMWNKLSAGQRIPSSLSELGDSLVNMLRDKLTSQQRISGDSLRGIPSCPYCSGRHFSP